MITTSDPRLAAFRGAHAMITGGVGLIGSALARRLIALGAEVLLVDSMVPEAGGNVANIADIGDRVRVNIADIRDREAMRHLLAGQHFLFDLAAQTSHLDSMNAPERDLAAPRSRRRRLRGMGRRAAPRAPLYRRRRRGVSAGRAEPRHRRPSAQCRRRGALYVAGFGRGADPGEWRRRFREPRISRRAQ